MKKPVAFSLTEVMVALGVLSFALIASLGLLSAGLHANKQASEETALVSMASQVVGQMNASTASSKVFFFDVQGLTVTNASLAAYRASAVRAALPVGQIPNLSTNFQRIIITFTWPASAVVPSHTNTLYASLLLP